MTTSRHPNVFRCAAVIYLTLHASVTAQTQQNQKCRDPISNCDSSKNYFPDPDRVKIEFAKETIPQLVYSNTYADITVNYNDATGTGLLVSAKYRFVICGCDAPRQPDRQTVYINPNGIYLDDSVSIAMIDLLDPQLKPLKYIKSAQYKYNKDLRDMVANGKIREATPSQLSSDNQLSAIVENPFGVTEKEFSAASERTPGIVVAEVYENSPLARAEWIKFFGLYLNLGKLSNELFANITRNYNNVAAKSNEVSRRPSVFFNAPTVPFGTDASATYPEKYSWAQPGGGTYMKEYMAAANADYRFSDNAEEGSPSLSLKETEGNFTSTHFLLNADWFPGAAGRTMKQFVSLGQTGPAIDRKLETFLQKFTAVRCGNVVSSSKRVTSTGANDFFEQAVVRPDLVLADYVSLLHPDVNIGDHKLTFLYTYTVDSSLKLTSCPFASLLGPPDEGTVYVDKMFEIEGSSRFEIQDKLETDVFPKLKTGGIDVSKTDFQFQAVTEGDNGNTRVLVRQQVPAEKERETERSSTLISGFEQGLGVEVKEVAIPKDSSGLGTGVIVGISIGASAVFVLVAFIAFRLRGRTSPKQFANLGAAGELPVTT